MMPVFPALIYLAMMAAATKMMAIPTEMSRSYEGHQTAVSKGRRSEPN
jgi:hypothetical protein